MSDMTKAWCFPADAIRIELTMSHDVTIRTPSVMEGVWDVWDSSKCRQGARLCGSYDNLDDALVRARKIVAEHASEKKP